MTLAARFGALETMPGRGRRRWVAARVVALVLSAGLTAGAGMAARDGEPRPRSPVARLAPVTSDLRFVPDPGIRVDRASNAWASVAIYSDASFTVYLYFSDRDEQPPNQFVVTSSDGLVFDRASGIRYSVHDPQVADVYKIMDPAGRAMPWPEHGNPVRRRFSAAPEGLRTSTSTDGVNFFSDPGHAYLYHRQGSGPENDAGDNGQGRIGYNDIYSNLDGEVFFAYIGDMQPGGYNNIRLALSTDNGRSFTWVQADLLGDAALVDAYGQSNCTFVDQKTIRLADGSIRMFTMNPNCLTPIPELGVSTGFIHSFRSQQGYHFVHEPGVRLKPEDFDWQTFGFTVYSLNDPVVVRLPGERYRMYVTAAICESQQASECGQGATRSVLVSASTALPP